MAAGLSDRIVGAALRSMHTSPAKHWTLDAGSAGACGGHLKVCARRTVSAAGGQLADANPGAVAHAARHQPAVPQQCPVSPHRRRGAQPDRPSTSSPGLCAWTSKRCRSSSSERSSVDCCVLQCALSLPAVAVRRRRWKSQTRGNTVSKLGWAESKREAKPVLDLWRRPGLRGAPFQWFQKVRVGPCGLHTRPQGCQTPRQPPASCLVSCSHKRQATA